MKKDFDPLLTPIVLGIGVGGSSALANPGDDLITPGTPGTEPPADPLSGD